MMKLNQRILLKKHTRLRSSNGKAMDLWSCCESVDGKIDLPAGQALAEAKSVHPDATAVLTIQSLHGVAVRWRAVFRMRLFEVLVVTPGNEAGTTILHCREP